MIAKEKSALTRVAELERVAGDLVRPLGVAEAPETPVYLRRPEPEAWDWVVLRLRDDPVFRAGELAIPKRVRTHLSELDARAVVFDDLLIAHEVPRGSDRNVDPVPGWELELVVSASKARVHRTADRIDRAVGAVLGGVARAAAAVGGLGSDPVLIGTIRLAGSPKGRSAWFAIAAWNL